MDRIKRLSLEVLEKYKDKFGTDFAKNKKVLEEISIVRSKELKNELAGFITKFIKRENKKQKDDEEKLKQSQDIEKNTTPSTPSSEESISLTEKPTEN